MPPWYLPQYSSRLDSTPPRSINFMNWLQLGIGHRTSVFTLSMNFESGPGFPRICFGKIRWAFVEGSTRKFSLDSVEEYFETTAWTIWEVGLFISEIGSTQSGLVVGVIFFIKPKFMPFHFVVEFSKLFHNFGDIDFVWCDTEIEASVLLGFHISLYVFIQLHS